MYVLVVVYVFNTSFCFSCRPRCVAITSSFALMATEKAQRDEGTQAQSEQL